MTQQLFDSLVLILGEPLDTLSTVDGEVVGFWEPITDRTLDDCVYGNRRGCFDHVCVNRISANLEYIHVYLQQYSYIIPSMHKTRLYLRSEYFKADAYNVLVDKHIWLAMLINYEESLPRHIPELTALLYTDVNDLEKIVMAAKRLGEQTELGYLYSNEVFSGEC